MGYPGNAKWSAWPTLAVLLRYGLAVTSVAAALGTTLILRHYNSPPRFISHFTMIAIAITHRHQPIVGIVVALIFAVAWPETERAASGKT